MAAHLVNRELDPDIWDGETLKPHIRKALLRIAAEFMIGLGVEVSSSDITLTGSMANFNYTPESDIDLHILLDFSSIDDDDDLVRQFLMTKKSLWNLRHNIQVKGHDVEVYPQDESEPHHSTGVYSLIKDEWLVRPHREDPVVDDRAVEEKFQGLASMIDSVLSQQDRLAYIAAIREKLRNMRKTGLQAEGEFSVENLAFKKLRREGYLDRLADAELQDRDASLSVAQEGSKMKISRNELTKILREELDELENPRHRGGSHDRATAGFDPPEDLLLGADEGCACEGSCGCSDHHDSNNMALTALRDIGSLASKVHSKAGSGRDLPDWVDFKLSSVLTHLRDINLYLDGKDQ